MEDRSLPGGMRLRASAPGSEAIADSLGNQRKVEQDSLSAVGDESPAEHIRNALQLGQAFSVRNDVATVDADVWFAIGERLKKVLELLEEPRVVVGESFRQFMADLAGGLSFEITPLAVRELELNLGASAARDHLTCKYCSCSEWKACHVDVASLNANDRDDVAAYHAEQGAKLPAIVPCWWISLDPPICSNPHCAELHRAQLAGVVR